MTGKKAEKFEVADQEYFDLVKQDFFNLRIEWRFYRSLFGTNEQTVDFLNSVSGPSAFTLERVLFERTLLGLRKLTDPTKTQRGSKQSVTVKGLVARFHTEECDVKRLVSHAERMSGFARDWSSRKIAHSDLEYRTGASSLEPASRKKVEDAMTAIARVIRHIAAVHYKVDQVTHPLSSVDDERHLLRILYLGQKFWNEQWKLQEDAMRKGDYSKATKIRKQIFSLPSWLEREDPPFDQD